jgi:Na+/H+ antiporter NhaD/arsenite permease-like protein
LAAAGGEALELASWSVLPFVFLLLAIALLPLALPHWWHRNRNRALVSAGFAIPVVAYLAYLQFERGVSALAPLAHEMWKYAAFIALLGSLYVVSGGILLRGNLRATPAANTAILAFGSVLSNLVGTTGASMLLIRPFLRTNRERQFTKHLPVFFIFTVSNLGGCLTPLGDPPLFLGFLNGVPFLWTLTLWREWLFVNTSVLVVFYAIDRMAYSREGPASKVIDAAAIEPLRLSGVRNLPLLIGIILGVLLQGWIPGFLGEGIGVLVMLSMGVLSLVLTPREIRAANTFTWGPIAEVAILFLGIFITMVPALVLLGHHGKKLGITEPWEFFWLTGFLSGFLDNAPTYLTFATIATGSEDFQLLVENNVAGLAGPDVLRAISCGAVFMGALTYIGNGPNFMVKAIAVEKGYATPSFFGYLAYSCVVLLPILVLLTFLFF